MTYFERSRPSLFRSQLLSIWLGREDPSTLWIFEDWKMQQNPVLHDYSFVKARPRGPVTDRQFPHNLVRFLDKKCLSRYLWSTANKRWLIATMIVDERWYERKQLHIFIVRDAAALPMKGNFWEIKLVQLLLLNRLGNCRICGRSLKVLTIFNYDLDF
jgi:hypothetical protein